MRGVKKTMKKIITAMICLIVLVSSVGLVSSQEVEEENKDPVLTFTIYRISSDGEISPIEVYLENVEDKDIGQTLEDICTSLFENDAEMQQYVCSLEENNTENNASCDTCLNLSFQFGMVRIKSHGRGFHFKTKTNVEILTKFKFFRIMLPRIHISARKPIVFCKYSSDERAKTTYNSMIQSYLNENATETIVSGNHSVFVRHFVGYTTWFGRISNPFSSFIPRAFSGIGRCVICKQLS